MTVFWTERGGTGPFHTESGRMLSRSSFRLSEAEWIGLESATIQINEKLKLAGSLRLNSSAIPIRDGLMATMALKRKGDLVLDIGEAMGSKKKVLEVIVDWYTRMHGLFGEDEGEVGGDFFDITQEMAVGLDIFPGVPGLCGGIYGAHKPALTAAAVGRLGLQIASYWGGRSMMHEYGLEFYDRQNAEALIGTYHKVLGNLTFMKKGVYFVMIKGGWE